MHLSLLDLEHWLHSYFIKHNWKAHAYMKDSEYIQYKQQ